MGFLDRFRRSPTDADAPGWHVGAQPLVTIEHSRRVPRVPTGEGAPTLPWGSSVDVVGESFYQDVLLKLCGGRRTPSGHNLDVVAELRREPRSEHDSASVSVMIDGQTVGYLSRENARRYQACIDETIAARGAATAYGTIRGGWDSGDGNTGSFGVRLKFSDRSWQLPPPAPGEHRLEPAGAVSVSNEERYQDALIDATRGRDVTSQAYPLVAELTIADSNPWTTTSPGPVIEVRIDGRTVGFLTGAMTARYLPDVEAAIAAGKRVTTEAALYMGTKKGEDVIEIRLHGHQP